MDCPVVQLTAPGPWNTLFSMRIHPTSRSLLRPPVRIPLFLLAGGLAWACSSSTAPLFTQWEGNLVPIPPATVEGRAAAVTQFGRTEISIQITDAEPGVSYGWRVDTGSCQNPGILQGGDASYPGLTPGPGGTATANAILSALFPATGAYAARVFLEESEKVVACGELGLIS